MASTSLPSMSDRPSTSTRMPSISNTTITPIVINFSGAADFEFTLSATKENELVEIEFPIEHYDLDIYDTSNKVGELTELQSAIIYKHHESSKVQDKSMYYFCRYCKKAYGCDRELALCSECQQHSDVKIIHETEPSSSTTETRITTTTILPKLKEGRSNRIIVRCGETQCEFALQTGYVNRGKVTITTSFTIPLKICHPNGQTIGLFRTSDTSVIFTPPTGMRLVTVK